MAETKAGRKVLPISDCMCCGEKDLKAQQRRIELGFGVCDKCLKALKLTKKEVE